MVENKSQLAFFKDYFYFEETRSNEINTQVSLLFGLVSILFAFIAYYLLNMPDNFNEKLMTFCFFISLLLSLVSLIIAIFNIYKILRSFSYRYLPKPREILNTINDQVLDNKDFESFLIEQYSEGADYNKDANDQKFKLIGITKDYILYALLLLVLAFIPYYVLMGDKLNTDKIEILNIQELKMTEEKTDTSVEQQNVQPAKPKVIEAKPIVWPKETYVQKGIDTSKLKTRDVNNTKSSEGKE